MRRHRLDPVSLCAGLLFVTLGTGFLLRGLDLARFRLAAVGPVLLIGLGFVIVASAVGRTRTAPAPETGALPPGEDEGGEAGVPPPP